MDGHPISLRKTIYILSGSDKGRPFLMKSAEIKNYLEGESDEDEHERETLCIDDGFYG